MSAAGRRVAAARDLARTGGDDAPVEIAEHDPAWAARFAAQRDLLAPLLAPWLAGDVEHIGSTAVPGLAAKPIVDIMAAVRDLPAARAEAVPRLEQAAGYQFPEAFNEEMLREHRLWLCKPSAEHRLFHLHLVAAGSGELERHLAFRDHLRARPEAAAEYEAVKRDLAARFRHDREGYTAAKTAFVRRVEANVAPPRGQTP